MGKTLLSLHVLAAIVFIGPVTVAVSLFPRWARLSLDPESAPTARPVLHHLHRISTVYAVLGVTVPAFGLALANELGVLTDAWLLTSIALTLLAALVLGAVVIPAQRRVMARVAAAEAGAPPVPDDDPLPARAAARLSAASGVFSLLWAVVVVLMVVRPGSTTGV